MVRRDPARRLLLLWLVGLLHPRQNHAENAIPSTVSPQCATHVKASCAKDAYPSSDKQRNETGSATPTMDRLVAEGLELDQAFVFKYCSPTRCALQTGRNPVHVNVRRLALLLLLLLTWPAPDCS